MSLYKRPGSPFWWVRIGRKTRQSTGTTDREQAEEFESILRERLWRRTKLGDRGAVPWKEATERWLKQSNRARERDRRILQWLAPRIGEEMISAIADSDALEQLREDGLAEGWTHSTVDRMMRTVRAVLRACWKWKWLNATPYVPMYGEPEPEPRFLTQAEFRRLCHELPPHLNRAARFAVCTLLRKTAQARLTWAMVDMRARLVRIPRANMKAGKAFGLTLSDEAMRVLRECRDYARGDYVFHFNGKLVREFRTRAFLEAAERAGVAPLRWHDLRHTGASWAVQSGVTLQELMALGDWRSYKSVLIYAHLAPHNSAAAARKVGANVAQSMRRRAS